MAEREFGTSITTLEGLDDVEKLERSGVYVFTGFPLYTPTRVFPSQLALSLWREKVAGHSDLSYVLCLIFSVFMSHIF